MSKKFKEEFPTKFSSKSVQNDCIIYNLRFECQDLESAIQMIILDYKVNFIKFKTWKVNARPFKAIATLYWCHWGMVYHQGQQKSNLQSVTTCE